MPDATDPLPARAFLVGVGGSGMMPLAALLAARGVMVAGSDRALDAGAVPAKFAALAAAGVALFPQDGSGVAAGGADQLVVASAAVEAGVPDLVAAAAAGAPRTTRAALLARLFNAAALPIGVAGTSGKSTSVAMLGWILAEAGLDPTIMNGAVMRNFVAADAPLASARVGAGAPFVAELDESDAAFPAYRPRVLAITNLGLDHKGLAELRSLFRGVAAAAASVVVNLGDAEAAALAAALPADRIVSVAVEAPADLAATDLDLAPFACAFTAVAGAERVPVRLAVPGRHNVANALVALAAARAAGVGLAAGARALAGYAGLRRRFELVGEAGGVAVIDDFAHNPDKVAATLAALRAGRQGDAGRLLLLFQPHGYGPLRLMGAELAAAFAAGMGPSDVLAVPDPVYQGGTVDRSVGSAALVGPIRAAGRDARHLPDRAAAAAALAALARPGDRVVVMGARDDTLPLLAADLLASIARRAGEAQAM